MLPFLSLLGGPFAWFLKHWKVFGLIALLGATAWYVHKADKKAQEAAETARLLDEAKDTIDDMRAFQAQKDAALERKSHDDQNRHSFELQNASRNQADRVAGDGPLAPVLRNGLSGIGRRQAEREARNPR